MLTVEQCELLLNMFNASLEAALKSGIPINSECYNDIEVIKEKLYKDLYEAIERRHKEKWH